MRFLAKEKILVGALLGIGFLARLAYALYYFQSGAPYSLNIDTYASLAHNLLRHWEYSVIVGQPDLVREPAYPIFLALVFFLFGESRWSVALSLNLINLLTCFLLYRFSKELFGSKTAKIALGIGCLYPYYIYYALHPYRETLLSLLSLATLYSLWRYLKTQGSLSACLGGALTGITALCKATALPFAGWSFLAILWISKNWKQAGLYLLFFSLTYSPWVLRNRLTFGFWMLTTPSAAGHFYLNLVTPQDQFGKEGEHRVLATDPVIQKAAALPPEKSSALYYRAGIQWISQHPRSFLKTRIQKFIKFWRFYPPNRDFEWTTLSYVQLKWISLLSDGLLIPLAVLGCFLLARWDPMAFIFLFIANETLAHMLFHSSIRFRLPLMALVIALAAFALTHQKGLRPQR